MNDLLSERSLNFVVALQSEATPLIEHFKLKSVQSGPFRFFSRDRVRLIISGMGKINTAAATAALLHQQEFLDQAICINLGIAGHESLSRGSCFVAHRISDASSGADWYPQMTFNPHCATSRLCTVEAPSNDYPENSGLDMEASAFYPIATRYIASELTQVVKVVSDTPDDSLEELDKQVVTQLVASAMPDIVNVVDKLCQLSTLQYDGSEIQKLKRRYNDHWRLTVSQNNALTRLLERHHALFKVLPEPDMFKQCRSSKDMLKQLSSIVSDKSMPLS